MKAILVLVGLVLLAACTPSIRSDVEVFHSFELGHAGRTAAVASDETGKADTLEFQDYARRLSRQLTAVGFTVVDADGPHDVRVVLDYGIDDGERVTEIYSAPGFAFPRYTGSLADRYRPFYGFTDTRIRTRSYRVYTRTLGIAMWETAENGVAQQRQVYSAAVRSRGTCGRLSSVIDEMLVAAFDGFPGENGSFRTIDVDQDPNGC